VSSDAGTPATPGWAGPPASRSAGSEPEAGRGAGVARSGEQGRHAARPGPALRRWGILVALVCVAVVGALALRSNGPDDHARANLVAVLPFAFRGDPQLSYLGEGMATLLAQELDALPGTESVDPRMVLSTATAARSGAIGPREAREMAARLGAGRFVLGDIL